MLNEQIAATGLEYRGYYQTARYQLLDLLDGQPVRTALEIGCGGGETLAALQASRPGCRTVGVELRADAAELARSRVDEVREDDVLTLDEPAWRAQFDLIVLSHVLEHFAEPERVLSKAAEWLAPGGRVLVALPNVRHISVTIPLILLGEFRYASSGILDQTHLRFYTRKSAVRMMTDQGWTIVACRPEFGGGKSRALRLLSLGLATDLAAYAYNFLLRRA